MTQVVLAIAPKARTSTDLSVPVYEEGTLLDRLVAARTKPGLVRLSDVNDARCLTDYRDVLGIELYYVSDLVGDLNLVFEQVMGSIPKVSAVDVQKRIDSADTGAIGLDDDQGDLGTV